MSIVKRFGDILYKKYILFYFLFFADDFIIDTPEKNTCIVNISENLNKRNLSKTYLQFTYPTDFYIICNHYTVREKVKKKKIDFFKWMQ